MKNDAIIVLTGGTKELEPCLWTKRRLDKAIQIFHGAEYIIIVSAGTIHKNPFIFNERPIFESEILGKYLIKKEIPESRILCDPISLDTIGNAYYCRTIHTDPANLYYLSIITSDFHMARSKKIFTQIFTLLPRKPYKLNFITVSDKGIDRVVLEERREKEKNSLENLAILSIRTLQEMHHWLYTRHEIYSIGVNPHKVSGNILESY